MTERSDIGALADFPPGEIRPAMLDDGTMIAVYNIDGQLYATADRCTHGDASLSEEGNLCGTVVECPWHNGSFDVTSGRALTMPCTVALRTYRIALVGTRVQVSLD